MYSLLAISPGPNFLVITQTAIEGKKKEAFLIALGVSTASIIWASFAALGLGYILDDFPLIRTSLQFLGAGYILYLGFRMAISAHLAPINSPARGVFSLFQCYINGLLTNLSNPKTLLFFASLFSGLFESETDTHARFSSVAIVATISIVWNSLMVTLFTNLTLREKYKSNKKLIDRIIGSFMIYFGARLLYFAFKVIIW